MFGFALRAQKNWMAQYMWLSMSSFFFHVSNAHYSFLENKHLHFSWTVTNAFIISKKHNFIFKILLEVSIVPAVVFQDKCVFIYIGRKRIMKTVMNVCNAKRAFKVWIFLLRTKTADYIVWRWWHILHCQGD